MDTKTSPKQGPRPFTNRKAGTKRSRRVQLPWPNGRPFKILSLDGGGIKGLFAASILSRVEQEITAGQPIADRVDMIAGTSTGGILAIGLGLGLSAASLEKFYANGGKEIFPPWRYQYGWLSTAWRMFAPLYDHKALERLLYQALGDKTLGESKARLVIPAFLAPKAEIAVLKTDHHSDFENDHRMAAWEAARATSAAPTYLRGQESDDYAFLDGGIWANNPIMVAITDALSAYTIGRENIRVLSLGTGNPPFQIGLAAARRGMWNWRNIIGASIYLTTDNAQSQAGLLVGPERIARIEPDEPHASIALDDWKSAAANLPGHASNKFAEHRDVISEFFSERTEPRERFYATR